MKEKNFLIAKAIKKLCSVIKQKFSWIIDFESLECSDRNFVVYNPR